MWAIVPVKNFEGAKQRLASALSAAERRLLFRAMLEDVLVALTSTRGLAEIALLTREAEARRLAAAHGVRVIEEPENRGHTAAVAHAADMLTRFGVCGMLTVPGDVPLTTAGEIEAALAAHRAAPAMTIVPAHDDLGSNCMICTPPEAVSLRFGDDSFRPHLAAARRRGIEPAVVRLPGLALDIDTPADLMALLARPAATRAHAYLNESGIAARLSRAEAAA